MNLFKLRSLLFVVGSLAFGGFVIVFSESFARITVRHESILHAISVPFYNLIISPIFTILLLLPFFIVGVVSAIKSNRSILHGFCLLICGHLPIMLLYIYGYNSEQYSLQKHAFTAAALSIGFMPFISVPLFGIGLLVGNLISMFLDKETPA